VSQTFSPHSFFQSTVDCTARRQGSNASVFIQAESEHQLTNILFALSRAVEAEQMATTSMKQNATACETRSHSWAPESRANVR